MSQVPTIRVRRANDAELAPNGEFVLYWMIAARRSSWNFALDRAVELGRELRRPVVVLEPLRCGYRWASDRLHRFVLDGMRDNARRFARSPIFHYPYVEPSEGAGKGLLEALSGRAAAVVTDEFPAFFLPRMVASAAPRIPVRLEAVDSCGLLPLRASDRVFETAYSFRRHLQKTLPEHLDDPPSARPLSGARLPKLEGLPREIVRRWPPASPDLLEGKGGKGLASLPVDHSVVPTGIPGGEDAATAALDEFLGRKIDAYDEKRNRPEEDATSGLSPYLHFGHLSVHRIFHDLAQREDWSPVRLAERATGSRAGWWGMSRSAEAFLDELVTWREVGFNMCSLRDDFDRWESLPRWARQTLEAHASDPRPEVYSLEELEAARTHDPLWNAAQTQLVREGRIHNYLRMLWGKKILQWSPGPREALDAMIELNNRYALDGRDPNSYTGIFWVLGRYDRPWAPVRPIFGSIRYMSSENTARKMPVKGYIRNHSAGAGDAPPGRLF